MSQSWYSYPIGHGYTPTYQGPNTDTPHWADDIETPFHTPITALLSGTVKRAAYVPWGSELFVQPDQGGPEYYYYHLDELDVSPGQHVAAGQVVGLSGGENPGFPGAEHPTQPRYSTGPHTHVGWYLKMVSTPIGMEPFGPDITPLLKQTQQAPGVAPLAEIGSQIASGQAPLTSEQSSSAQTGFSLPGLPNLSGLFTIDTLYRVLFGFLGVLFIYLAIKHFTGSSETVVMEAPEKQAEE